MGWVNDALPGGTRIHYGSHDAVPPLLRGHYGTLVQLKSAQGPQGEHKYRVLVGKMFYAEAQDGWFTTLAPDANARLAYCLSDIHLQLQNRVFDQALQRITARVYAQPMSHVPDAILDAPSPEALVQTHRSKLRSKKARAELASLWEAALDASAGLAQAMMQYVEAE